MDADTIEQEDPGVLCESMRHSLMQYGGKRMLLAVGKINPEIDPGGMARWELNYMNDGKGHDDKHARGQYIAEGTWRPQGYYGRPDMHGISTVHALGFPPSFREFLAGEVERSFALL